MTYNYQGNEYQIIRQIGDTVQFTKAYRMLPHNFIEIITLDEYKPTGEIEAQKIELHIQDIVELAAMLEVRV